MAFGPASSPRRWLLTQARACVYKQGIELNPRIGNFDLKMFLIVRIGMMSWLFVNFSTMMAQYYRYGEITNSMILINAMHGARHNSQLLRVSCGSRGRRGREVCHTPAVAALGGERI